MVQKICLFLGFLLLLSPQIGFSQNADTTQVKISAFEKSYLKSYYQDIPKIITSPAKWSKAEYIGASTVALGATISYAFDKQIMDFVQKNKPKNFEAANTYFFDPFGKGYYTIPLMAGVYIYGAFTNKSKPKAIAMDFAKATVYSGVFITLIKHIAHRQRPFQTDPLDPYNWDGPAGNINHTSFPSGHTIMAFTFASVISEHYKNKIWVPITMYSLATLEGIARMEDKKHWASDVIVGGALGYAIGTWVVNNSKYKFQINPWSSAQATGLSIRIPL